MRIHRYLASVLGLGALALGGAGSMTVATHLAVEAETAAARSTQTQGAARRLHTRQTSLVLRVPVPHRSRVARKIVRLHRKLRRREIRKRRLEKIEIYMRLRRADGVWTNQVGLGRKAILTDPDGRRLVELRLGAKYNPARGALRYAIRIENLGISASAYRRARVPVRVTARYRF